MSIASARTCLFRRFGSRSCSWSVSVLDELSVSVSSDSDLEGRSRALSASADLSVASCGTGGGDAGVGCEEGLPTGVWARFSGVETVLVAMAWFASLEDLRISACICGGLEG